VKLYLNCSRQAMRCYTKSWTALILFPR
jgi:hypothetical protein